MNDNRTIQTFTKLLGLSLVSIKYIETKFQHNLSGDWSAVNTDLFVLHSPEWEINLSNGGRWFLTNPQDDMRHEPIKSDIIVSNVSIIKAADKTHTVPNLYGWESIFGEKITRIKFYKRVLKGKNIFNIGVSRLHQENIQIIQFFCAGKTFSITAMDGDLGQMTFYPTGYLGGRLGFFFNKTVADSHTVFGQTMTMVMIKEVKLKN